MKAIILSAGQGSRLGHLVDGRPKCLIDFNGRTLLDRQLDTLEANGVHEAVVVTGFHDELVNEAIARRTGGPNVRTVFNPFYKVADNTGSLFMSQARPAGFGGASDMSAPVRSCVAGSSRISTANTRETRKAKTDNNTKWLVTSDPSRYRTRPA